jgi:hypothetical protein
LVWAGNPEHKNDHNRSVDIDLFQPLAKIKGVSIYSLQVGGEDDVAGVLGKGVAGLGPYLTDFCRNGGGN